MPSVDSWQERPLALIDDIFKNRSDENWIKEVHNNFESRLNCSESIAALPSLNDVPAHMLQPNSLIRFRCMIQDTYDNEFFLQTYRLIDKEKGLSVLRTSCFQDIVDWPENFEADADYTKSQTGMRQVLYCVSVPGETEWVKKVWQSAYCIKPNKPQTLPHSSSKREREDDDNDMIVDDQLSSSETQVGHKKAKQTSAEGAKNENLPEVNKNNPLPDEDGPVCLVKVYDESAEFKVNEVFEFYGILSVDPGLSSMFNTTDGDIAKADMGDLEENRAHHPPASLVPRLHVVAMRKLSHVNPLLPLNLTSVVFDEIQNEASSIRISLVSLLEKATLGDSLAAEYLLLHLVSRVYARRDMLALGKFSLNISGVPPHSTYPRHLSIFLNELVTKLHCLPMTIEKLNKLRFVPTKNYNTNRLDTGILQLSEGTLLILDETTLMPGQMDANGIKNVQALKGVLSFQKVNYDFQFHEASFDCNIKVLVISEGKSLLPCDCQIELKPKDGFPENIEEHFASFCSKCPSEFLHKFRKYISLVALLDYQLTEDMTQVIQDDFVAARREDTKITADDLHAWLVLARLMSTSAGHRGLSPQRWGRVKALETQRKERLIAGRKSEMENGH